MALSETGQIWNRACFGTAVEPRAGDMALAALIRAHGLMMNGGVFHAIETHSAVELREAIAGFRFFGLEAVAEFLERAYRTPRTDWGRLEGETDRKYGRLVPSDSFLSSAFERHFAVHRDLYSPLS